jgi:hypothetical protein
MTATSAPTVRLGGTEYPVVLPNVRDPRLHVAAVIISIHVLGQVALGFRVSVPQIVVAIVTCAAIDVVVTFRRERRVVWPASGMLTGSGVALILRLVGMPRGATWSWEGWWLFAAIAGFSLATKYLIRWRGTQVFNPSNVGLVVAFVVLGSNVIEPLDFWWGPLDPALAVAYGLIVGGGVVITRRLGLLTLAVAFWVPFAVLLGALAASGHCITTAWSLDPVCGADFWRIVTFSPEVMIFLFFMITDPRTVPVGRRARIAFGVAVAAFSVLLIAPHQQEFGAKVGLLAGLVLLTPVRTLFDRLLPRAPGTIDRADRPPRTLFATGAAGGAAAVLLVVAVVAAGIPARPDVASAPVAAPAPAVRVDAETLPDVAVSVEAAALDADVASDPSSLAVALAQALAIEAEAMRRLDTSLLRAADTGVRLLEMERAIEAAATAGTPVAAEYTFDTLRLDVAFTDGPQGGASLVVAATGRVDEVTHDAAGTEVSRTSAPLDASFVLVAGASGTWLIEQVLPPEHQEP